MFVATAALPEGIELTLEGTKTRRAVDPPGTGDTKRVVIFVDQHDGRDGAETEETSLERVGLNRLA